MSNEISERRHSDRFPVERELSYRVLKHGDSQLVPSRTINISSSGVLFALEKGHAVKAGMRLELAINWPVQHEGRSGLQLVAKGRVVRVQENQAAIEMQQYEFRTSGQTTTLPRIRGLC